MMHGSENVQYILTLFFFFLGGGHAQKQPVNYNVLNKTVQLLFCPMFFC